MCGIAGIIDPITPPTPDLLEVMAAPLIKRGPDDGGQYLNGELGLAHRRLAVIDVGGGRQPMFNEDKTLVIVFNGEIYDYSGIRAQLIAKGHRFTTSSDTEVLLHLYEEEGEAMLSRLNGMFAFAIFNTRTRDLFLARDRFGKKPLFYAANGSRLAFASGPASLFPLPWVDTTIDRGAIHDYLEYQYIPTPRSICRGIHKLPPGGFAIWKNRSLRLGSYYSPSVSTRFEGNYQDACGLLLQKLEGAVQRRLVADVPLGMFLSGGMDSSLICAIAQRQLHRPALTFSIGFPEKKFDERSYSQAVAEHLGTQHHFLEVVPYDLEHLKKIAADYEEPFCDSSMLPTSLLSKFTRQHVTVALSGDGADEFFGGYNRYQIVNYCRFLAVCPASFRQAVKDALLKILPPRTEERTFWGRVRRLNEILATDGIEQYLALISRFPATLKARLYGDRMLDCGDLADSVEALKAIQKTIANPARLVDQIIEIDIKSYLHDDILVKVDRASMAYGLEVRSPYLDVEVAELGMSIPYAWKQAGRTRKKLLRDACGDLLPKEIFGRKKMGFGVPVARWLRNEWKEPVRALLLDGELVRERYFRRDELDKMFQEHCALQADYSYAIFAILILELWMQQKNFIRR